MSTFRSIPRPKNTTFLPVFCAMLINNLIRRILDANVVTNTRPVDVLHKCSSDGCKSNSEPARPGLEAFVLSENAASTPLRPILAKCETVVSMSAP